MIKVFFFDGLISVFDEKMAKLCAVDGLSFNQVASSETIREWAKNSNMDIPKVRFVYPHLVLYLSSFTLG